MPTENYSIQVSPAQEGGSECTFRVRSVTTTSFDIETISVSGGSQADYGFSFTVNATNAVLPQSFTEAQIQSVLDLIAGGITASSVPRAYGSIQGTGAVPLLNGFNSTVEYVSTGTYRVVLGSALPSANYCVQLTSEAGGGSGAKGPYVGSQTTTSFIIYTYDGSGSLADNPLINYVLYQNQD
tara:strand:- start:430 stop:978 length:549 start_codon:yes stop_codon:yes gene_type:complete